MNTLAYILYLLLTYIITFRVGLIFFRNGRVYIFRLFGGDEALTDAVNRLLLIGYYLLNAGYAAVMISNWETLHTPEEVLVTVLSMTGKIMLCLAVIHFINMAAIYLLSKRKQFLVHHKK